MSTRLLVADYAHNTRPNGIGGGGTMGGNFGVINLRASQNPACPVSMVGLRFTFTDMRTDMPLQLTDTVFARPQSAGLAQSG